MRPELFDQAIETVEDLEFLVNRLGIYVTGSTAGIKRQLEKLKAEEVLAVSPKEFNHE